MKRQQKTDWQTEKEREEPEKRKSKKMDNDGLTTAVKFKKQILNTTISAV